MMKTMEAVQFEISKYPADIIVTNNDGKIVLLVEVKANKNQQQIAISQLKSYLSDRKIDIQFAMFVSLEKIYIFKVNDGEFVQQFCLPTVEVLSYYDAEFASKKIFIFYLITLLEAWLRDLAYHWKSEKPPASEKLKKIGLLEAIEGGDTFSHNG